MVLTALDLLTKITLLCGSFEEEEEEEDEEFEEHEAMVTPVGGTVSRSVTGATRLLNSVGP